MATLLSLPTRATLYHAKNFSSSRPLFVLMELGVVIPTEDTPANKKQKTEDDDTKKVSVQTVTWDQLKNDPILTKLNPQRRLPFFYDPTKQDLKLHESGGLVQYLLETYDPDHKLHPAIGDAKRPAFLQLLHFGPASGYHVTVHLLFPGSDIEKKKKEWHDVIVPTYEQALSQFGGPYLLGDTFTAVDAVLAYELVTAAAAGCAKELFEGHPQLSAYHERLRERSAYKYVFPAEEGN